MSQIFPEVKNGGQEAVTGLSPAIHDKRKFRMSALALADEAALEAALARLDGSFSYTFLRRPEAGLVMVEGRAGNSGRRFNLGEMLVTRCVVRLQAANRQGQKDALKQQSDSSGEGGAITEGYSFIQGNRPRHAELAALFDALLQQEDLQNLNAPSDSVKNVIFGESLENSLIAPLTARREQELRKRAEQTAATKVDFFTLVRGEDE